MEKTPVAEMAAKPTATPSMLSMTFTAWVTTTIQVTVRKRSTVPFPERPTRTPAAHTAAPPATVGSSFAATPSERQSSHAPTRAQTTPPDRITVA